MPFAESDERPDRLVDENSTFLQPVPSSSTLGKSTHIPQADPRDRPTTPSSFLRKDESYSRGGSPSPWGAPDPATRPRSSLSQHSAAAFTGDRSIALCSSPRMDADQQDFVSSTDGQVAAEPSNYSVFADQDYEDEVNVAAAMAEMSAKHATAKALPPKLLNKYKLWRQRPSTTDKKKPVGGAAARGGAAAAARKKKLAAEEAAQAALPAFLGEDGEDKPKHAPLRRERSSPAFVAPSRDTHWIKSDPRTATVAPGHYKVRFTWMEKRSPVTNFADMPQRKPMYVGQPDTELSFLASEEGRDAFRPWNSRVWQKPPPTRKARAAAKAAKAAAKGAKGKAPAGALPSGSSSFLAPTRAASQVGYIYNEASNPAIPITYSDLQLELSIRKQGTAAHTFESYTTREARARREKATRDDDGGPGVGVYTDGSGGTLPKRQQSADFSTLVPRPGTAGVGRSKPPRPAFDPARPYSASPGGGGGAPPPFRPAAARVNNAKNAAGGNARPASHFSPSKRAASASASRPERARAPLYPSGIPDENRRPGSAMHPELSVLDGYRVGGDGDDLGDFHEMSLPWNARTPGGGEAAAGPRARPGTAGGGQRSGEWEGEDPSAGGRRRPASSRPGVELGLGEWSVQGESSGMMPRGSRDKRLQGGAWSATRREDGYKVMRPTNNVIKPSTAPREDFTSGLMYSPRDHVIRPHTPEVRLPPRMPSTAGRFFLNNA